MAASTFHEFPRLPKELRDMIWDEAIRPDLPAAHFFTPFDNYTHIPKNIKKYAVAGHGYRKRNPCSLAAPRCSKENPDRFSWIDNNPSMYMEDSGLWSACTESRAAMIRRFGNHRATDRLRKFEEPLNSAPATGTMLQDGRIQYFTVCRKTDLFCIQPVYSQKPVSWDFFQINAPIFSCWGRPKPHIALEYNPGWMDKHPGPGKPGHQEEVYRQYQNGLTTALEAATRELGSWACYLWFIDYSIRRDPSAGHYDSGRCKIFQGRGYKYVEVGIGFDGSWCEPRASNDGWVFDDSSESGIHEFIGNLRVRLIQECLECLKSDNDSDEVPFVDYLTYINPKVGVLACIPDN
ncbi:hypothetical protein M426DRAFT_261296 [Hypoxylon sp. CI-4A]|nr:hypothetical protein M426DRAFT_261296 [Hypoxylon sp. CI-4A]